MQSPSTHILNNRTIYGRHHIYHHQRCTFHKIPKGSISSIMVGPATPHPSTHTTEVTSALAYRQPTWCSAIGCKHADPKVGWATPSNLPQAHNLLLRAWGKVKDNATCLQGNVTMTRKVWFSSDDYVMGSGTQHNPSTHICPRQLTLLFTTLGLWGGERGLL